MSFGLDIPRASNPIVKQPDDDAPIRAALSKAALPWSSLLATVLVGLLSGLPGPAGAGFDEGVAAYNRGDYATALREFRLLAENGNADAQYILSFMHNTGQGVYRSRPFGLWTSCRVLSGVVGVTGCSKLAELESETETPAAPEPETSAAEPEPEPAPETLAAAPQAETSAAAHEAETSAVALETATSMAAIETRTPAAEPEPDPPPTAPETETSAALHEAAISAAALETETQAAPGIETPAAGPEPALPAAAREAESPAVAREAGNPAPVAPENETPAPPLRTETPGAASPADGDERKGSEADADAGIFTILRAGIMAVVRAGVAAEGEAGLAPDGDAGVSAEGDAGTAAKGDPGIMAKGEGETEAKGDAEITVEGDAEAVAKGDGETTADGDTGFFGILRAGIMAVARAGVVADGDAGLAADGDAGVSAKSDAEAAAKGDGGVAAEEESEAAADHDTEPAAKDDPRILEKSDSGTATDGDGEAAAAGDAVTAAGDRAGLDRADEDGAGAADDEVGIDRADEDASPGSAGKDVEIVAGDDVRIVAGDNVVIVAGDNVKIIAGGNTKIIAGDNVEIIAGDNVEIVAGGNTKIIAGDNVQIVAGGNVGIATDNVRMVRAGLREGGAGARSLFQGKRLREITFPTVMRMALERNLDILIAGQNHLTADTARTEKRAAFDPLLSLSWSYTKSKTLQRDEYIERLRSPKSDEDEAEVVGCITVDGQVVDPDSNENCFTTPVLTNEREFASTLTRPSALPNSWTAAVGLTQLFGWGGEATVNVSSTHKKKNSFSIGLLDTILSEPDPFGFGSRMPWTSNASVSFVTPLPFTKNFGRHGSQQNLNIDLADNDERKARAQEAQTRNSVLETTAKAFWDLVESLEELKTNIAHRKTLEEMFIRTKRMFDTRRVTAYEMDQVEAELGNLRNKEEISWDSYLATSNTVLRLLDQDLDGILVPVGVEDLLEGTERADLSDADKVALENSPDIKASMEDLASSQETARFRDNQTKLDLSLSLALNFSQSDTTFGYKSWKDSITRVFTPDKREFIAQLRLTYPFGRRAENAAANSARRTEKQASDNVRDTRNKVVQKVSSAVKDILSGEELVTQTETDLKLAVLAYEKAKELHDLGLVTKFELLEKLDDLRIARLANNSAKINLRRVHAELMSAQGLLDVQYATR